MKIMVEVDLSKHNLAPIPNLGAALAALSNVYSQLWTEAFYDPYNDSTKKFAREIIKEMDKANIVLGFSK